MLGTETLMHIAELGVGGNLQSVSPSEGTMFDVVS
jgi:hypothetical protein